MRIIILLVLITLNNLFAFSQVDLVHTWSKALNNDPPLGGNVTVTHVKVDPWGNAIVAGYFENNADFDPGPGRANLKSNGGVDIFFAKYDPNGNYVWAKSIGGSTSDERINGMDLDGAGTMYFTGVFRYQFDFDPDGGVKSANGNADGNTSMFIAKYNNNGNYVFANCMSTQGRFCRGVGIAVGDNAGGTLSNIYVTGDYTGFVDFDPGPMIATIPNSPALNSQMFIARYDIDGHYQYAKAIAGVVGTGGANGSSATPAFITLNPDGYVFIVGTFRGTVDFSPFDQNNFNLSSVANSQDIFIAKYTDYGEVWYAESIGGPGENELPLSFALDLSGNMILTGTYGTNCDFDPFGGIITIAGSGNFFAKLDEGGYYVFAYNTGNVQYKSITFDGSYNIYLAGSFSGTIDVDLGPGTVNLTSFGTLNAPDICLVKYSAIAGYIYAKQIGSNYGEQASGISYTQNGNLILVGTFGPTSDMDPGPGVANIIAGDGSLNGPANSFVARYTNNGGYINAIGIGGYPNVSNNDYGKIVKVDNNGNVYTAGYFSGGIDADPGSGTTILTGSGNTDIYFAKFDPNGTLLFARKVGGTGYDFLLDLILDNDGNIFITGSYSNTVDFDPGPGTANLQSISSSGNGFFAKYDNNGNYVYAKTLASTLYAAGHAFKLDNSGNLCITGQFTGTCDFNPGAGTANLSAVSGSPDMFIAKYDGAGNYLFAGQISGSNNYKYPNGLAVDQQGNIFITGSCSGTSDFDPGPGIYNLIGGGIFIAKYDNQGNLVFVNRFGNNYSSESGNAIAFDAADNILIAGNFSNATDFDPGPGTAVLTPQGFSPDAFFAKYNNNGAFIYAKQIGGTGSEVANALALDGNSNIYITGYYSSVSDFDPGTGVSSLLYQGGFDLFIAKYDENGNYINAKNISSSSNESANAIAVDNAGNVLITGNFDGICDFDPSIGIQNLSTTNSADIFIAKYSQCSPSLSSTTTSLTGTISGASTFINGCALITKLTPTGVSPVSGNVIAKVFIDVSPVNFQGSYFVKRHFEITPFLNPDIATAKATLYLNQTEFDEVNSYLVTNYLPTNANDAAGIHNVRIIKISGESNNGTGQPNTYAGTPETIDPDDNDIIWDASNNRWEISFSVTGFSGFFIGNAPNVNFCPGSNITLTSTNAGSYQWQLDTGTGFTNLVEGGNYNGTNTNSLLISNIISSMYGYKFRCVTNGTTFSQTTVIKGVTSWTGNVSYAWENPANWSCGILPDANTDVIFNTGTIVVNSNVTCRSIDAKPGTSLTINPGYTITITGQ